MTSLDDPQAIRHFQSICDACQELTTRYHTPSELRLYADGYLHALRKTGSLDMREQNRLDFLLVLRLRFLSYPKMVLEYLPYTVFMYCKNGGSQNKKGALAPF